MDNELMYVPVFRSKQQEIQVLKSFVFDKNVYPYIEIIKELDRVSKQSNKEKQISLFGGENKKTFESVYGSLIRSISAQKIFIDLPTHLSPDRNMKQESLNFLRTVISKREKRTSYLMKLKQYSDKIIPVISSYLQITGENDSIYLQAQELKKVFPSLAYRIMVATYEQDISEIIKTIRSKDYIFIDFGENILEENDWEANDIKDALKDINVHKIIHRCHIPETITMSSLEHGQRIEKIDNSLPYIYKNIGGNSFSDFVGIKKDNITNGGVQSPGLIFYDAVENAFFGYRYTYGGHKKGEVKPDLNEFETTIVPAVLASSSVKRMRAKNLDYLNIQNWGWNILNKINNGEENGKSPAKFKRISMQHYLHCIQQKMRDQEF
ncbi:MULTISPECIES: beta family protein [Leeuwenhoekiella]|uniref:beta family protein n=1 Tax=Leeuwenhoekiella TaxID=283735 RepID=UPI002352CE7B|nr:hypothetical protein [Leeuwenhoekiella blandensis]|tara:strand:- start:1461 stop:2600 length:1140 start_codon:yes stop_codon:yes gene_type:complete